MAFAIDNNTIAKNTVALYVRMAITMAVSFFTARVTLQQLGVEDYGLNNLVGSIVSMFSFINGSMGTAVQRFYSIEIGKGHENGLRKVFGTGLYLHLWVSVITIVLAEVFAVFFLDNMNIPDDRMFAAQIVFQISIISLALNIVNVPYAALLRAREMFDKIAVVEIIQSLMRLGILYLLVVIGHDKLIVLSVLGFFVTLFNVGAFVGLAWRFDEAHSKPVKEKELISKMMSFISLLLITVLCQLAKTQGLVMMINVFFGLVINAAYAVAVQVSNMVNTFAMSFKQSMVPQMMAACGAKDYVSMQKIINAGTKITFLLMMMISAPVIFETDFLLRVWLGNPPEHAANLVRLVLVYINISSFTYFQYQGVHAVGNIKIQQICVSFTYFINILLIYLVFKLGASFEAALYVNMFISFFQCLINLYCAQKYYGYDVHRFVLRIVLPSLGVIIFLISVCLPIVKLIGTSLCRFVVVSIIAELVIAASGYVLLLDNSERKMVIVMLNNIMSRLRNGK